MAKLITYDEEARAAMKRGMDALADAVKTTLGPKGRNVALDKKYGAPTVTHDGVTVAKDIELDDPFENMGAQLLKEAATKTKDVAGDGTTTATVLAQAIVNEGLKNVAAGANPMQMKLGIDKAAEAVAEAIKAAATPVKGRDEIAQVATVSAADPEIGDLIAEVMDKVGKDGVITVEESKTMAFETEYVEGMQFDRGYICAYFVTDTNRMEADARRSVHPDHRQEDQRHRGHAAGAREAAPVGQQGPADHRRGRRRRGARDARRQQAARHAQRARRQGARLRRSAQGDAARHRHPDRRHGHQRGARPQARLGRARGPGPRTSRRRRPRTTRRSSRAAARRTRSRAASSRSRPRSRTRPPTTTRRSSRSGWPSCPAAWRSSRSAPAPRPSSRRRSTASRTPCRRRARRSRRASSPAAAWR